MANAVFIRGNPEFRRHKPSGVIAPGTVLDINGMVMITHSELAADEWGNASIGGGVYSFTAAEALSPGDVVNYVNASDKVAAIGDIALGRVVEGPTAAADGDEVWVELMQATGLP